MDLILKNKYKISLHDTKATLKESIDTIAYTLNAQIIKNSELVNIGLTKYDSIQLYDYTYLTHEYKKMFDGYIYDIDESDSEKTIDFTAKERTVNMEESEDEYSFPEGQTATQRATQICNDWGIPIGSFLDTSIELSKYRSSSTLFNMLWGFFKETAQKGGNLYKYRMEDSINIIQIGSNSTIYKLESIREDSSRKSSLNGAVTQVKVLGENKNVSVGTGEKTKTGKDQKESVKNYDASPTIGVFSQYTDYYGTFQKIVQDSTVTDYSQAQEKANSMFNTGEEVRTFKCGKDIADIRAGDQVSLDSKYYYVTSITHDIGEDSMDIEAMETLDLIRSKFYAK